MFVLASEWVFFKFKLVAYDVSPRDFAVDFKRCVADKNSNLKGET